MTGNQKMSMLLRNHTYTYTYCHVFRSVNIDEVWSVEWIYWPLRMTSNYSATANLQNSQITTAPAKPFCSLWLLVMEILQLPALTSLLSGEYPATELWSTVNSTITPSLLSLPSRARLNCQPHPNSLTHSSTNYFTSLKWTAFSWPRVLLI
jgi:hypothetical protein